MPTINGNVYISLHMRIAIILFFLLAQMHAFAQEQKDVDIESLENTYKDLYGLDRIEALIDLAHYYESTSGRKATRYAKQAVMMAEEILLDENNEPKADTTSLLGRSYLQLGIANYKNSKYIDAKEALEKARTWSFNLHFSRGIEESDFYLHKIDSLAQGGVDLKKSFLSRSLQSLELDEKINRASLDWNISQKVNAAEAHVKKYEYDEAIEDYNAAIDLLKNKGDQEQTAALKAKIQEIDKLRNVDQEVAKNYEKAITEQAKINQKLFKDTISTKSKAIPIIKIDSTINTNRVQVENLTMKSDSLNAIADEFLKNKNYEQAERYRLLSRQVEDEIKKREDAETQLILLRQQKQLSDLDLQTKSMQLEAQRSERQNFIIGTALLLALAVALLTLYVTKRRDHRKLGKAYRALEETKAKLTDAERNIRKLLRQQVSEDIAKELMAEGTFLTTKKSFVCIMFLDIRGFTPWAENHAPEEIIEYQNLLFGFMIDIVNEYNGNVNQLLGDGFMATFGAPKSFGNDCQNAYAAAKKIISVLNEKIALGEISKTKIGIGLHAGNVVTGNVGSEFRKQYSITGNTVILASRIEQLNKEYDSQLIISREVRDKLDEYEGEETMKQVMVKGRNTPIEILTVL
jgi:class 3 adenylate cyclase